MQISPKIRRQLRWQNITFIFLFLGAVGLVALLSTRYVFLADWTANKRNTPSDATLNLLKKIEDKVTVTAFVSETNAQLRNDIQYLIDSFRRYKSDIEFRFIDPASEPAMVRELNVSTEGEIALQYKDKKDRLLNANEQTLTNALQRLARTGERLILFLEGHEERNAFGDANYDLGNWSKMLQEKGFKVKTLNLASDTTIPRETAVIIIADPQKDVLPGETQILQEFVDRGGNLLWLVEPGPLRNLDALAEQLNVDLLPGTIIDQNVQLLGITDPRFAIVPQYPAHPITQGFATSTIFPAARALSYSGSDEWEYLPLLETLPRTWSETDDSDLDYTLDAGQDIAGPLIIGITLSRAQSVMVEDISDAEKEVAPPTTEVEDVIDESLVPKGDKQQRIVIIGDSDFLSNAYLGQAGNLDLGLSVVNWLSTDDEFVALPTKTALDSQLQLSTSEQAFIAVTLLFIIPALLLGAGIVIWWQRRKG